MFGDGEALAAAVLEEANLESLSTPEFLIPDAYYAIHRNPRKIIFVRHNRLVSQYIIRYKP